MPDMSKQYQLILGTFIDNEFIWHDVNSYDDLPTAYKEFKKYVNSQLKYTDEELAKVWNSGRLDIELRRGNRLLNWVGIYAREVDKGADEEEDIPKPDKKKDDKKDNKKDDKKDEKKTTKDAVTRPLNEYFEILEGKRKPEAEPVEKPQMMYFSIVDKKTGEELYQTKIYNYNLRGNNSGVKKLHEWLEKNPGQMERRKNGELAFKVNYGHEYGTDLVKPQSGQFWKFTEKTSVKADDAAPGYDVIVTREGDPDDLIDIIGVDTYADAVVLAERIESGEDDDYQEWYDEGVQLETLIQKQKGN